MSLWDRRRNFLLGSNTSAGKVVFLFFDPLLTLLPRQDYVTYLLHRLYHTPWLYKHFHKLHHTYKHPTAFSVTAIHPVEVLHIQMTLCLPLFAFPVHWGEWKGAGRGGSRWI